MKFKVFLIVLVLLFVGMGVGAYKRFFPAVPTTTSAKAPRDAQQDEALSYGETPPASETDDGRSYTLLNLMELSSIVKDNASAIEGHYVMRGMVYENDALCAKRLIGLSRYVITCCIVDAVAYGIGVEVNNVNDYKDGQWLKIYGHPQKYNLKANKTQLNNMKSGRVFFEENFIFIPDKIVAISEPPDPYINNWSIREPFNY